MLPSLTLHDDVQLPRVGFGVYKIPDDQVVSAVRTAVEAGYRAVDTATLYQNERGVGEAVRTCGLPREELFVTTKLWNTDHGYDAALRAFETSRAQLGLDYVDLYLIHWPQPSLDRYVQTWRALDKLRADGVVRAIGVSNFQEEHLGRLIDETGVVPALNQVEAHPNLQQAGLRAYHERHGIVTQAWRPLGTGPELFGTEVVRTVAEKHGRTPAQVVLRWHLELGHAVIPKSVTPHRIAENLDLFGFELDSQDIAAFATLESGTRLGLHPDAG